MTSKHKIHKNLWDSRNRRRHDPVECTYVISGDADVDDVDVQERGRFLVPLSRCRRGALCDVDAVKAASADKTGHGVSIGR